MAKKLNFSYAANDNGSIDLGEQEFEKQAFEQSNNLTFKELSAITKAFEDRVAESNKNDTEEKIIAKAEQAVADIVGKNIGDEVVQLPIKNLVPCRQQWNDFSEYSHQKRFELLESIVKFGIWHNIVVRATDESNTIFEVLSGNHRVQGVTDAYNITKSPTFATIPAKIYRYDEIDDDDAHAIVVLTNYIDRNEMSNKDKFTSNIFLYEYHKRQRDMGKTSISNIAEYLAKQAGVDKRTIYNHIGLRMLTPKFFSMLNNREIPMRLASKLCQVPNEIQDIIFENYRKDIEMMKRACDIYKKSKNKPTPSELIDAVYQTLILTDEQRADIDRVERTYTMTAGRKKRRDEEGMLIFVPRKDADTVRELIKEYIVSVLD